MIYFHIKHTINHNTKTDNLYYFEIWSLHCTISILSSFHAISCVYNGERKGNTEGNKIYLHTHAHQQEANETKESNEKKNGKNQN